MDRLLRAPQTRVGKKHHSEDSLEGATPWIIAIEQAEYVEKHRLRLCFSDGETQIVDFEPFLRGSLNPMIRKYLDLNLFREFTLEHGDLLWGDYDLCFPIADLYAGQI